MHSKALRGLFHDKFNDKQNDKFNDRDIFTNQEDYEMRDDHIQFDFFIGVKCKTLSHKPPLFPCVSWAP